MASIQKLSGKDGCVKLGASASVTGATASGGNCVVTSGLSVAVGDIVLISGVTGMTDLNNSGKGQLVTAIGSGTFTVALTTSQTFSLGGTAQRILPITQWSVDVNSEIADVTDSESGEWKENIVTGHKSWSGSYSGFLPNNSSDLPINQELAVELVVDSNNSFAGNAIFTNAKVDTKVPGADAVAVSGSFTGNGALTKA